MKLRCLIVDDSPRFLDAARGLLERQGLVVGVASSSAEALRRAAQLRPDIALLDIDLGGRAVLIWPGCCPSRPVWRVPG